MENREFFIDHDGLKLHAKLDFPTREAEKYPVLILGHGYTGHMEEDHLLAAMQGALDAGYAVLRVELYGHGQSSGLFRDHTILKWMEEMQTVVEYAAHLPFADGIHLSGHSQGGLNALLVGGMEADRLKSLLLLAPATMIRDLARAGWMFERQIDPNNIPDVVDMGGGRLLGGSYIRAAQLLPIEDAIDRYQGPVGIIHAIDDSTVPIACAEMCRDRYKNAMLHVIGGGDHCYVGHEDELRRAVKEFLLMVR